MRAVHSYRVRIRLTRVNNYLPDFSHAVGGFLSSTGAPPEWRPKAEILKTAEEDGLAAVELLGWPPRTDRA